MLLIARLAMCHTRNGRGYNAVDSLSVNREFPQGVTAIKQSKEQLLGWGLIAMVLTPCVAWLLTPAGESQVRAQAPEIPEAAHAQQLKRGKAVYIRQCMECHGKDGQGIEGAYDKPFAGDRSVQWLTRRIERTMPEGEADLCVGQDAEDVAKYLYEQFYAPSKQDQARISLQRLTVEQHRQSLADLVGSFREKDTPNDERGLRAQIYPSRWMDKDTEPLAVEINPTIDVTYTSDHPLYDQFDELGHSVRWSGSLLSAETGVHEIAIHTEKAFKFWLNDGDAHLDGVAHVMADMPVPFIDGWQQTKDQKVYRRKVFLIAGRAYPLILEFSAHNQGVDEEGQAKYKSEKDSYIHLKWVPPGAVESVIPQSQLSPVLASEVFVTDARFPPDDASMGFITGGQVSAQWLDGATNAAVKAAAHIAEHLDVLAGTDPKAKDRQQRVETFCVELVERAFRRPITEAQAERHVRRHLRGATDLKAAAKNVALSALLSPHFLYPNTATDRTPDGHAIAGRLALAMWDGLPDRALRQAADEGRLSSPDQVRGQAERMLNDPRAKAKLMRFFHHWLELERAEYTDKDTKLFPEFDKHLMADLRTSLDLFIEHAIFSEQSDFRELLLADYMFMNERLAGVYGVSIDGQPKKGFSRVKVQPDQRSGVITHPYLLTAFAYHNSTSPIHRGVFLTRNIIGRPLNPPPDAIAFSDTEFDPDLTMREKVTAFTRAKACMACHETINPLGFSLENYDSIGRWRTKEKDKPIDAESDFIGDDGKILRLKGARDVAAFAVESEQARRGFVRQLCEHMLHHAPAALSPDLLDELTRAFAEDGYHVRRLFMQIAVESAKHGVEWDVPRGPDVSE